MILSLGTTYIGKCQLRWHGHTFPPSPGVRSSLSERAVVLPKAIEQTRAVAQREVAEPLPVANLLMLSALAALARVHR